MGLTSHRVSPGGDDPSLDPGVGFSLFPPAAQANDVLGVL